MVDKGTRHVGRRSVDLSDLRSPCGQPAAFLLLPILEVHQRENLHELSLLCQSILESASGFELHEVEKDESLMIHKMIPDANRRELHTIGRSLDKSMGQQDIL